MNIDFYRKSVIFAIPMQKGFPVKFEFHETPEIDSVVGAYRRFFITANGFVIASFVDETSRASYADYLKKYGIGAFPKNVLDAIIQCGIRLQGNVIELPDSKTNKA